VRSLRVPNLGPLWSLSLSLSIYLSLLVRLKVPVDARIGRLVLAAVAFAADAEPRAPHPRRRVAVRHVKGGCGELVLKVRLEHRRFYRHLSPQCKRQRVASGR